jgi:S1-C subfamily serine protease
MRCNSSRLLVALVLIGVVLSGPVVLGQDAPAQLASESGLDVIRIQQATVFVLQAQNSGDNLNITCFSSGTIVSRDGLILTNAHSTVRSASCPGETLVIALTVTPDAPPVPRYRAEILQQNEGLDLALLRINREFDGRLIARDSLVLPFVPVADSETVNLDDTVTFVGYPGIGSDSVLALTGTVTAFVAEPSAGAKSWFKTNLALPASVSGGGAYNRRGELIGIPTTAPVNAALPGATCVTLQDTNRDDLINSDDLCIPVGGSINTLRPSNFARPLIRAAQLGLQLSNLSERPAALATTSAGAPSFRRLFFSPSVNEAGMPTTVIRSLPAGSTSLYMFFDYSGMTPETVYELRVTTDGIPNQTFSLSPVRWSGGPRGMWHIGSSGQPWPNGVQEFILLADGVPIETARLTVGGAPEETPQFSDPIFGVADALGNVSGNGYVLPTGNVASAIFVYRNMTEGIPWASIWYYQGSEVGRTETTWSDGTSGAKTISIQDPAGLLPGEYRLELYIDGRLSATSDFTLAGAQEGAVPRVFTDAHFTSATSAEQAAVAPPVSSFSAGTTEVYAGFDWQNFALGTRWNVRWLVDGEVFFEESAPWTLGPTGENYLFRLANPQGLPDGDYRFQLYVGPLRISEAQARVGIGRLPIDPFALSDGVQLRGQIMDAATGLGIPGASFILISDQFSVADFLAARDMAQVFALAATDRQGRFEIVRPLSFDSPYSVLILADGYLPIEADGVTVERDTPLPIDMTIYLSRG